MASMMSMIPEGLLLAFRARHSLVLENLALRHQIVVLQRSSKRPRLKMRDRVFWVLLSRIWSGWRESLSFVKPETVIRWHRRGFRLYWTWKSRRTGQGRPTVSPEVRELIHKMSRANPLWGAPRVHGELQKLGIEISQAAVSKYMVRHRKPPSQSWRTFLDNHVRNLVSVDFFTVTTRSRCCLCSSSWPTDRRRVIHFNVTATGIYGHEFTSKSCRFTWVSRK